jgi:hypothetical protein
MSTGSHRAQRTAARTAEIGHPGRLALLSHFHGRHMRPGKPIRTELLVDPDQIAFPQTQIAGRALYLLPHLAIIQVQHHFVGQALYADYVS